MGARCEWMFFGNRDLGRLTKLCLKHGFGASGEFLRVDFLRAATFRGYLNFICEDDLDATPPSCEQGEYRNFGSRFARIIGFANL